MVSACIESVFTSVTMETVWMNTTNGTEAEYVSKRELDRRPGINLLGTPAERQMNRKHTLQSLFTAGDFRRLLLIYQ